MAASEHGKDELVHAPVPGYPTAFYVVCAICFVWLLMLFVSADTHEAPQQKHGAVVDEQHIEGLAEPEDGTGHASGARIQFENKSHGN